jgi:hypothetical protein
MDLISINAERRRWKFLRPEADNVHTNPDFARRIVEYFRPTGFCLDPCRGGGAFYDALPEPRDWCEVQDGRDFLRYRRKVDWIITNPPWSGRAYRPISRHAFEISDNVVFLLRLQSGLGTYTRLIDPLEFGHGLKEVVIVDWADAGFPSEGFALAVFHWKRGYRGHPAFNYTLERRKKTPYVGINELTTSVEWYTPPYIFDALGCRFDLDPASPGADVVPWIPVARCFTKNDDGLMQPWAGFIWLNPPYGEKILPLWVDKFIAHGNGIILVAERTSTRWWQRLSASADLVLCVNKKIAFISGKPGRKTSAQAIGSTLIAVGRQGIGALERASQRGLGRLLKPMDCSLPEAA